MKQWLKYLLLALILLLMVSFPLARQFETGSLEGTITNDRGAVVKASVEIRNVMTGTVFRATSDAAGTYKADSLPAGRYSLWVQAADHDSLWMRQIVVERGQTAHQDVHLARTPTATTGL